VSVKIINKGTGAGGTNTNNNGLAFEKKTCMENKLLENKFNKIIINKKNKYGYYFELITETSKITYVTQTGMQLAA